MENKTKPLTILSILKWYGVVWSTLALALLFADLVNPPLGTEADVDLWAFVLCIPVTAYLWSLVSRKIT